MNKPYFDKKRKSKDTKENRSNSGNRSYSSSRGSRSNFVREIKELKLSVDKNIQKDLNKIGVPEFKEIIPDDFQVKAAEASAENDVIVSAPTGSGKTWIALEAIKRELALNNKVWYASPLKALSNSKFLEFSQKFGAENVGLLTGDHKANPEAAIMVGTTEILRNQLYDAMAEGKNLDYNLIILDEAHYLGDSERGVVWEEVLIYLPSRVRLLLLSATINNAEQISAWLSKIREKDVFVIANNIRPVPLSPICLLPSGKLISLEKAAKNYKQPQKSRFHKNDGDTVSLSHTIVALRELNLLPAIFFLKSRRDCDLATRQVPASKEENFELYKKRAAVIDDYLEKYSFLKKHKHIKILKQHGLGAHHAGHLPHYKMLVEELMSQGLLEAIFATSTVSAGVNFPARTVVIKQSDKFNGKDFKNLSSTELTQMSGRAGRRGHDYIGFALLLPGQHMDFKLINNLFTSVPNDIISQLKINFSMVLNLLKAQGPEAIEPLLNNSLSAYQIASQENQPPTQANIEKAAKGSLRSFQKHLNFLKDEKFVDENNNLTEAGLWAADLRLDHPLVFYAGVKENAWPNEAILLAAVVAGLVAEKENQKTSPKQKPPKKLLQALNKLLIAINPMVKRLEEEDFQVPIIFLRPAWAMWSWAINGDFDLAVEILGLGEGDLAMLALRTAEHLRQLSGIKNNEELSNLAHEAIFKILKEPVSLPLEL